MAIQGVVFAPQLNQCARNLLFFNETHPKVAYCAQNGRRHDYLTTSGGFITKREKDPQTGSRPVKKVFNEENAERMWHELIGWINKDAAYSVSLPSKRLTSLEDHE